MASGRLDLFIAKLPLQTVVLTINCFDTQSELHSIPQNTPIIVQHNNIKQTIQLQFLEGRECYADFIEMNYALARTLQLHALRRYLLTYNAINRTLTIKPSPLSKATATVTSSTLGSSTLSVGYELLSQLGIPERSGALLNVRSGKNVVKFHLHIPANLSDNRLRLPSIWFQKWKLNSNQTHLLQYDQRNSTLSMASIKA